MRMTPTPRTPEPADQPERREPVYEPPALVEVGGFAEVTRGFDGPIAGDFPAFSRGFWLI
jgi:hypothetical protein